MSCAVISRRTLLSRLGLLGAGAAGLYLVRDRLPWPPLRAEFAGGRRRTDWIDLPPRGDLLEIPGEVAGSALRVVVDSGAQFSAIDRSLAERLDLPRTVALPMLAYGVSGGPSMTYTVGLDLALPQLSLRGLRAAALDLAGLGAVTGRPFSMLLGRDALRALVLEADFPRRRLAFHDPSTFVPRPDAQAAPMRLRAGAPMLPVQVEQATPLEVMVDTGATGALALSREAADAAGLLAPGRRVSTAHSVSLGGISLDQLVEVEQIAFAGVTVADVAVQIYAPSMRGPIPQGLLGVGALRRFELTLDLAGARMLLTRPAPRLTGR